MKTDYRLDELSKMVKKNYLDSLQLMLLKYNVILMN